MAGSEVMVKPSSEQSVMVALVMSKGWLSGPVMVMLDSICAPGVVGLMRKSLGVMVRRERMLAVT